jgi:CRISPR/Cas system-associated endonuclease Cas1
LWPTRSIAYSVEEVRELEAQAAACYWQAWVDHPQIGIRFARKDLGRVPEHWLRFDGRRSVLMSVNGNRRAERPANALLNFLYSLVEPEAIRACHMVGLGLVHLDAKNRASFAPDLMEPVRPAVERYVLDLLCMRLYVVTRAGRRSPRPQAPAPGGHQRIYLSLLALSLVRPPKPAA